jgi:hypothetical protein
MDMTRKHRFFSFLRSFLLFLSFLSFLSCVCRKTKNEEKARESARERPIEERERAREADKERGRQAITAKQTANRDTDVKSEVRCWLESGQEGAHAGRRENQFKPNPL